MSDFDVRWLVGAGVLALFVLLILGMYAGWRAKGRAQAGIAAPPAGDALVGAPIYRLDDVHYVATTLDERPLERLVRGPLAFRGRCLLEVLDDGVRVSIRGTDGFAIPRDAIESIGARTATIDRVVERDGLTTISWRLPASGGDVPASPVLVHTSFRIVEPAERERAAAALGRLAPGTAAASTTTTTTQES